MNDLAVIARAAGVSQASLLALAPANDPFSLHQPARRRKAEWFADLFERFGFGQGVHVRRIHYRIISQDTPVLRPDGRAYRNTTSAWALLVNASRDARYLGLVPRDAFVDRRNPDPVTFFEAMREGSPQVSNDSLWLAEPDADFPELPVIVFEGEQYGPATLVEIWCEKSTMNDVLLPVAERYGVNLVTGAGEMSETSVRLFLDRAKAAGVPARILYISDFDPAGRSMPVAVARKIEFAQRGLDVTLDPVVLTEEQCRDYRLPRTPIKDSERRGARFEARFGAGATELDALEALHPGELARIVSGQIERYIDPDHARAFFVAVGEHKDALRQISAEVHDHYIGEVDDLEREYSELVERFGSFRTRAESVFERIADQLTDVEVPHFDPPAPRPPDDPAAPMFDARRDYLTQIAHYHAWQGRGEGAS
jgi:hypothetical protein